MPTFRGGRAYGLSTLVATLGEEPLEKCRVRARLFDGRHVVETWVFFVLNLGSTGVEDGLVDGSVRLHRTGGVFRTVPDPQRRLGHLFGSLVDRVARDGNGTRETGRPVKQ